MKKDPEKFVKGMDEDLKRKMAQNNERVVINPRPAGPELGIREIYNTSKKKKEYEQKDDELINLNFIFLMLAVMCALLGSLVFTIAQLGMSPHPYENDMMVALGFGFIGCVSMVSYTILGMITVE